MCFVHMQMPDLIKKKWTENYGRKASIWKETNLIGVTAPIYNDTVSVSKKSKNITPEFKKL